MAKGKRKADQAPLALEPEPAPVAKSLDGATQVRFTRDFAARSYGLPNVVYKAGTVISNGYMIGLLRKANAPIEAI